MAAREDGQAFWDSFARSRQPADEKETAALALHGFCPIYDSYRDRAERIAVRALIPRIDPNWRVLDIGCGPGRWTVPFAAAGANVTAVDFSPAMLEHARKNCEAAGVSSRVQFKSGQLEKLDADALGGPFNLVLAMGVIQYVPNDQLPNIAERIAECVNPGGHLLHRETFAPHAFTREAEVQASGVKIVSHYKSFEEYRSTFEANGLRFTTRRSIIPPSLALSLLTRFFPCELNARNSFGRGLLRAAIALRENIFDPLCRLSPELLWRVNSRRPTDQGAVLYTRAGK